MPLPSASVDGPAQRFDFFAEIVGNIRATGCDIADAVTGFAYSVFGLVRPIAESVLGFFVAALQIAAHLFAGLGCEQKCGQGSGAQPNEQECNCGANVAAF